jgi:dienelactone hydrolase
VVSLVVGANPSLFSIASVVHPAMVEPDDAKKIKIPFILLASGDEPADKVKEFGENLTAPHHVETFHDQIHGWMGARGDLAKERVKEEYTRGYKTVVEFLHKHWPSH